MKAVRINSSRASVTLDNVGKPEIMGPDEVIVRVAASGLCRTDLHTIDSLKNSATGPGSKPYIMGHENAGIVDEIGENVPGFVRGDRVLLHPFITCGFCHACRRGDDMHCANSRFPGVDGTDGGFAEFMKTSWRSLVKIDASQDLSEMAPLADAGNTAYHAVKYALPWLLPHTTALVFGIGGLGHIALQLLRKMTQATLIAADISEMGFNLADESGADHILDAGKKSFHSEISRLTDGDGVTAVLDFVGENGTPDLALKSLGDSSLYLLVGYGGEIKADTLTIMGKEITIRGSMGGTFNELAELATLAQKGALRPRITRYQLEQYREAIDDLRSHRLYGRAVINP